MEFFLTTVVPRLLALILSFVLLCLVLLRIGYAVSKSQMGIRAAGGIAGWLLFLMAFWPWHAPVEFIVRQANNPYYWLVLLPLLCVAIVEYRRTVGPKLRAVRANA